MRAFQKILFPIDMSDSCTATASFVEAMARRYKAEVTMLHVLEMPSAIVPDWYGGAVPVIDTSAIWQAETEDCSVVSGPTSSMASRFIAL